MYRQGQAKSTMRWKYYLKKIHWETEMRNPAFEEVMRHPHRYTRKTTDN